MNWIEKQLRYLSMLAGLLPLDPISPLGFLAPIVILYMIDKTDYFFMVSRHNYNSLYMPVCFSLLFSCSVYLVLYSVFGDSDLVRMDEANSIFLLYSLFVLIMYSICYSITINLIWIELNEHSTLYKGMPEWHFLWSTGHDCHYFQCVWHWDIINTCQS